MTILSSIRSRVGLLVGIIFLALLAFVLTDLFNSQRGIFSGAGSNDVGEINGHTISFGEFRGKVDEYTRNNHNLSEQQMSSLYDAIWQEMINKYVFQPQFDALGLTVTSDELAEQMMGDHPSPYMNQFFSDRQSGQIYPQFANPDGSLNGAKVREFVQSKMSPEQEDAWTQYEKDMREYLLHEKYNNLLRKGLYVTTSEAKREYNDENTKYNFKFILKKYTDVSDSDARVKPTDAEMREYYNNNQWKFKQRDDVRAIDYVSFDVYPSADDIAKEKQEMESMKTTFQSKSGAEDSLYVMAMNESGNFEKTWLHPGQFPVGSDSAFYKAQKGDVLGPFNVGENIVIYKKVGDKNSIDSMKVRHLLVAFKGAERADPTITRTEAQAKMRADSILRVVKSGKAKLEDLVVKLSDDPGSKNDDKKGDYGWITEQTPFVQEFKDFGFKNPKGTIAVVKTGFGYHVMEVLDQSGSSTKVEAESISKKIEPSETTRREVYNKALEFSGKNNTGDLFEAATTRDKMTVLKAGDIQENSKAISGIDNPREIVRWIFDEKSAVGSVSQPFAVGDRYIVANITKVLNKGVKPFEEVKDLCMLEVRKQKKAQVLIDEFNKAKAPTIDQWAAKMNLAVTPGTGSTFASPYIAGAGYEGAIIGSMVNMQTGKVSDPLKGVTGVYVVVVESVTKPEPIKDVKSEQTRLINTQSSRVDGAATDILKDAANILDNRAKHF